MSRGRRARLRTTGALLLSAFTAHACADAEPIDPAAVAPATRDLPRERVEARFPGKTVGIAAQVELGDLRAAIVWPMLEGGGFVDDEIVAIAFARDGRRGRWRPHGEAITLSTEAAATPYAPCSAVKPSSSIAAAASRRSPSPRTSTISSPPSRPPTPAATPPPPYSPTKSSPAPSPSS
jgi:hypothetical protein